MNDLISRQVAIDELQKEINKGIPPFDDVMGAIRCGVRLARNIIEDLPSAQSQWIPCSVRLPKEFDGKVAVCEVFLVTVKVDNHYYVDLAVNFGCYVDGFWDTANDWYEGGDVHVVAWMPLPKPYGGESDETD